LVNRDLPKPTPKGQWVAQCMKLAPRAQKDLLCKIVYVFRRHARQEHGVHHPEKPPVQFAESAVVAGARGVDHLPQFAALVRDNALLLPAFGIPQVT
jgi:hypothetical protein